MSSESVIASGIALYMNQSLYCSVRLSLTGVFIPGLMCALVQGANAAQFAFYDMIEFLRRT
jgi:hypothetical protein